LKQKVYRSDIIAFGILLIGYFISFFHLVSKAFNIPIPEQHTTEDTHTVTKKIKKYNGNKKLKKKDKKNKKVKFTEPVQTL
jgi:hypothetical protein